MPKILPLAPTPGAARLKAIGQAFGYSIQTIDLNIQLWNKSDRFKKILDSTDTSFFDPAIFPKIFDSEFKSFCAEWISLIVAAKPKWVGLSVISYQCELFTREFCRLFKAESPDIKVVLGGPGASSFGEKLKATGAIDQVIVGEAEIEFLKLLGESNPQLKNSETLKNQIFADYSDYDLGLYSDQLWQNIIPQESARGAKTLFITGSTGCIRNCSFCDVRDQWKKFYQRQPTDVVKEIEHLNSQYGVTNFFFTDSLINGDQNKFNQFVDLMIETNSKLANPLTYEGYMICRSQQSMDSNYFDRLKQSGLRKIYLGVETGSDKVRRDMNKGYSRADLDYFVEQLHRANIEISLLLMVGFPTETEQDFADTLNLISQFYRKGYLGPDKIIRTASFNWTTIIPDNSPLFKMTEKLEIDMSDGESLWRKINFYQTNEGLTIKEINTPELRAFRYKRLVRHLEGFGLQLRKVENFLQERENHFLKNKNFYWRLAKVNFETENSEIIPEDLQDFSIEWSKDCLKERISTMIFIVYRSRDGLVQRIEGLMSELADRIDGQMTIDELITDVCEMAQVSSIEWKDYFVKSIVDLKNKGILNLQSNCSKVN